MIKRIYYILKQRIHAYAYKRINKRNQIGYVLMLHDISNDGGDYSITKDNFIKLIDNNDFCLIEELKQGNKAKYVLTFDDAFENVYYIARNVLSKLQIPYYIFICVEYIDKEGYLSNSQIKEMVKDGYCHLGSHLLHHKLARFMSEEELTKELIESKDYLEKTYNTKVDYLAFPYGSMYACSKSNIEKAKRYYKYVFTTIPIPCNEEYINEYAYPRININDKTASKGELSV